MIFFVSVMLFISAWCYLLYPVFLRLFALSEIGLSSCIPENLSVTVIIPVYNEQEHIQRKIEEALAYDKTVSQVIFTDASDDSTTAILEKYADNGRFKIVRSKKGRSHQINKALKSAKGDVILITDVDASLPVDTVSRIVSCFAVDVGAVAAKVLPPENNEIDRIFWQTQNMLRSLESGYYSSPVASGACYAFVRRLIARIPDDVWADDIYVPFMVNFKGYRVVFADDIIINELRGPESLRELLVSKIRKVYDNQKETKRIFKQIFSDAHFKWKVIFVSRSAQLFVAPVCLTVLIVYAAIKYNLFWHIVVLFLLSQMPFLPELSSIVRAFVLTNTAVLCSLLAMLTGKKVTY